MSVVVLLGPQRLLPTLRPVVTELGIDGPIAAITAGWEEREQEDDELAEHLEHETLNLELYERAEVAMAEEPELLPARRALRAKRRKARGLYRLRLDHALAAVRVLIAQGSDELIAEEVSSAFAAVRELDERHLERITLLEAEFAERWSGDRCPAIQAQREEIADLLTRCPVLAIAGGHVGILTELLRLFGIGERLKEHSILAWSAGAMALGRRIVLFHDRPPQGFGNAEVWGPGLGLYDRYLLFPNARRRLALDDPQRLSTLARRFAPRTCVPMDEGDMFSLDEGRLAGIVVGRALSESGEIGVLDS